ncbi:hypothetical protein RC42_02700 [Campylobacter jejuni]|nr:hypothetical protein RC42_02700 [Campylobacter jejuni]
MQMQEVIEKLKDILASEGKCNLKTKDIAKELGIHPDTFNSMKFRNSIPLLFEILCLNSLKLKSKDLKCKCKK